MNKLSSKLSTFIITFFLGAIILSFALTGFEGFSTNPNAVATVDGSAVTFREYNNALNQRLNYYSQMFGGKSLTSQQIRQFRIKEGVIESLVNTKVMLNEAKNIGLAPSQDEIKADIKKQEFFLTNKKFDVQKYKAVLSANKLTPTKFEQISEEQIAGQKLAMVLAQLDVSESLVKEIANLKGSVAKTSVVSFQKESLTKYLSVKSEDISKFIADEKNKGLLETLYESAKNEFNKPAEIKASHILLQKKKDETDAQLMKRATTLRKKLNSKNFKTMANKNTQDPSGKKNGGDLGWFSKGRMVPQFEKVAFSLKKNQISAPVKTQFGVHIIMLKGKKLGINKKLEDVRETLAKRQIQRLNRDGLNKLINDLKVEIKSALNSSSSKKINALTKKYDLKYTKNIDVNKFDLTIKDHSKIEKANILKIFSDNSVQEFDSAIEVTFYKANKVNTEKFDDKKLKDETMQSRRLSQNNLQSELIISLKKKAKVVTYTEML